MTQAEQLAAQAAQWQAAGRADMAAQLYTASLEQDPSKFAVRMQLAECLVLLGQPDHAAENYLMVAQAYAARRRQQECLAICERIIAIAPHAFVYMSVGPMVRRIGRHARALCAKAAEAHLGAGRQTDGLQMLRLGAELDPHNPEVRLQLARIYSSRHMTREAVDVLSDAGNLLIQAKRYTDYIEVAQQILQLDPADIQTLRDLPRVYLELNKPHEAVTILGRLTKASPGDIIGYEILAQAFALIGRTDKALSVLERLVDELGTTGQGDKADAILNHARYWRPTDLGFLRSLKRMEIPRPAPVSRPSAEDPRNAAPEGTVVLSIADLVVDEGDTRSPPGGGTDGGVRLTEAEGTLTLNLSDLILSEMEQAAGHGVSPPTVPPGARSAPSPRQAPPSAKDVPSGESTISLDGADLLAALIEVDGAEPGANPWPDTPTRPDRVDVELAADAPTVAPPSVDDDAMTVPPPSAVSSDDALTVPPPSAMVDDDEPTIAPPATYEDDATTIPPSSMPPGDDAPATVALHLGSSGDDEPTIAPGSMLFGDHAPTLAGDGPAITQSMSSLIYDEEGEGEDEDEDEDAEPATLLHMKPLTAEDIAKAMAQARAAAAAQSPAPPAPVEATPPAPAEIEAPAGSTMGGDDAPTIMRMQPLTAEDIAKAMAQSRAQAEVNEDAVTVPPGGAPAEPEAPPLLSPPATDMASAEPEAPPLLSPPATGAAPTAPEAPPLLSPPASGAAPAAPDGPPLLSPAMPVVPNTQDSDEDEEEEMTMMNMTPLSPADLARGRGPGDDSGG